MKKTTVKKTVQEVFLKILADSKEPVAVYLRHGIKLTGRITGFDENVIFLEDLNAVTQLVLKDAVSTVTPIFTP